MTRPSRTSTTRRARATTRAWSPTTRYQGAADAEFAQSIGVKNVYILNDKEAYGLGVATNFENAAKSLGIKIAGFDAYDPKASSYEALFKKIQATGADAVFIGGLICENGAQLIKDKVAVLGPNDGAVKLITPDGFATQQTIDDAGSASAGMYMSVAGQPIDKFQGAAENVRDELLEGVPERQDDRPVRDLRRTGGAGHARRDRCLGRLTQRRDHARCSPPRSRTACSGRSTFNANGDPEGASGAVVAITIYKATDKLVTETVISPKQATVNAALGE